MTTPDPGEAWEFLRTAPDEEISLVWASLVIARDEYPDLDFSAYERVAAQYGDRARELIPQENPLQAMRGLNDFMFEELGFEGNQADYYDPRNSYLNEVFDRKLGIPISLAVVQLDIAQRVGLPLKGVSFPGHFLVSLPVDGGLLVLDPYSKGRSLDAGELKRRAQPHVGNHELRDDQLTSLLSPATNRAILTRMLRNLKALYTERDDYERALRCTDRLLLLDSEQPAELRDRGLLYLRIGHLNAGREDLSRYLAENPNASDLDQIRQALIDAAGVPSRVN
ncbi:MAG TPA: tetratricopeptide repeat protein [Candidatus Saccharimonadia bacterium]|nr:tetratricopeptide repeat protein [Candidatus Saccharimonadia bacterium]